MPPIHLQSEYTAPTQAAPGSLTIEKSVATALAAYPEIKRRIEESRAAHSRIALTREQEYMPKAYSVWEEVAASHNKLTQILFGDPVMVANPGPGLPYQTFRGNWFSGTGFLFDWAPLDFGLHRARVNETKAEYAQSQTNVGVTQLDVQTRAANAFLDLVIAQEQVKAAEANVKRFTVVRDVVNGLVTAGLRPGVDISLAEAELADIRNQFIAADERRKEAIANLANAIGEAGTEVAIDPTPVEQKEGPPVLTVSVADYAHHPLAVAQNAAINVLAVHKTVLSRAGYPTLRLLAGMNWRGAGLDIHGKFQKKNAFGLWPEVPNWNVGAMVNWNFLDWIQLHQQKVITNYQIAAQQEQYAQIIQNLKMQDQRSRAMLEGAIKLAQNMPIELNAAHEAEVRARTRYQTGLGTIEEVADSERVLARAEVQDAVAKVGVWKALLAISTTRGSVTPFLNQIAAARTAGGM